MSHNEYSQQLAYDAEQRKTTQGITEYEIEYGDMLDEDDQDILSIDCYTSRVLAVARYKQLVKENKYDFVDLVERSGVVDGCCASSDDIMSYKKEKPSYKLSHSK